MAKTDTALELPDELTDDDRTDLERILTDAALTAVPEGYLVVRVPRGALELEPDNKQTAERLAFDGFQLVSGTASWHVPAGAKSALRTEVSGPFADASGLASMLRPQGVDQSPAGALSLDAEGFIAPHGAFADYPAEGSVRDVLEWAADDPARAAHALEVEHASDKPRKALVPKLEALKPAAVELEAEHARAADAGDELAARLEADAAGKDKGTEGNG